MSNIDLKKFVDINIQPHVTSVVTGIRDTVVLFTPEGTVNTVTTFTSLANVPYTEDSITFAYLKQYFDNGGIKAEVHEGIAYSALTKDIITSLDNSKICIACATSSDYLEQCYNALKSLAISMNADSNIYGINEKIILASTHLDTLDFTDTDYASVKNFAVKYSSIPGAEMSIAAYLSQTNIDAIDSIKDYAFTQEQLSYYDSDSNSPTYQQWVVSEGEDIDDETYSVLQAANINVDVDLAGAVRNCGGNCKNGADLVNDYVRIILHQTLTDRLINLLTQKIKNSTGVSKLYVVIAQELERYLNCGYLTTGKVWTDNSLVVTRNNVNYTIISKGDALVNGYAIKILPMASLTDAEKAAHKTPPIYVIIADQYSIRQITINGEVI